MSIYVGNTKIGKMYLGSTEIAEAYLGSAKVYKNGLPSGYTQLEYISPAKSMDTGISASGSTWEVDVVMDSAPSSTQFVISTDQNAGHWFGAISGGYFSIGGGFNFAEVTTRNVYTVTFGSDSITVTCNGESKMRTGADHANTVNLFGKGTSYLYGDKCYGVQCTSGGSFIGVPAQRNSDSHQGLYDIANGVFYDLS